MGHKSVCHFSRLLSPVLRCFCPFRFHPGGRFATPSSEFSMRKATAKPPAEAAKPDGWPQDSRAYFICPSLESSQDERTNGRTTRTEITPTNFSPSIFKLMLAVCPETSAHIDVITLLLVGTAAAASAKYVCQAVNCTAREGTMTARGLCGSPNKRKMVMKTQGKME